MSKALLGLSLLMLVTLGAGCTLPELPSLPFLPKDLPASDVDLAVGSTIVLEQIATNPLERFGNEPDRVIMIEDWVANDKVDLTWSETYERETAASITAREQAKRATPVGETASVPAPVTETIELSGSIAADALDDGSRISLPSEWQESEVELTGSANTVIWLSKSQYDELTATRYTHLAIGLFDASLQTAGDAAAAVKSLIVKITSDSGASAVAESDVTEISASADWGTYTLKVDGKNVRVQTIQAENKFASYTILANPDNPIILKVELKAWAYGTEALGIISDELQISGYSITQISQASVDPS